MSLKDEIRRYVLANADAAETAKGVLSMWLRLPRSRAGLAEVEQALEQLVAEGTLERHALPGGTVIYRRARDD